MDLLRQVTKIGVGSFLALSVCGVAYSMPPLPIYYQSPMGEEHWQMTGNRLRCGLSLTVPNYGTAYFEQYAARPAHFIMDKWQKVTKALPMSLVAMAPSWKPGLANRIITKTALAPGEYDLYLKADIALSMLDYLNQGYLATFHYLSEQGTPTRVTLSPIRFKSSYSEYMRCVGNLLPFDFEAVQSSTFRFNTDKSLLSMEDKLQLDKVAQYCRADSAVKFVEVAGFTDDTGRKSYNNAISEFRAKAVGAYLASKGVKKSLIKVTWFGLKRPLLPNDTEEGRAANRRVEVKIYK